MTHANRGSTPKLMHLSWAAVFVGGGLVGCGEESSGELPIVQQEASLQAFGTCGELERYVEDTAVQEMRVDLDSWNRGGFWFGIPEAVDAGASAPPRNSAAPRDYTTTNTQVDGVDEADFMKNDGTRIFVLSGRSLYLVRSWPPQDLAVSERLELEGWPLEMFLDEQGRVVVFSSWWPELTGRADVACGPWGCGASRAYTRVTVVDTSGDRLRVEREAFLPGSYVSSRRIGSSVRVVLRENLSRPNDIRYWPENFQGDPNDDREAFEAAMDALKDENERVIRAQSLDDWIPQAFMRVDGADATLARPCETFHRPNTPVRLGLTTVATLDLGGARPTLNQTSVLGEVGEIYASEDSLYLASPHWWWWPAAGQTTHTYVHKFDIRNPSRAQYVGSGGVPGYLLDQFSMDEHLGFLRIATTVETWRTDDSAGWRRETSNRVTVLGNARGHLVEVGSVTGLAEGEQIQSARFVGHRGFVVTFEQIDPLFTLDLGNPFAPRVVGELKVPGFSTYIHPLDADHLLTIGVDLPEPDPVTGQVDWRERAMKLTVFDVGDFAQPREKFTQRVGTAYGWSEAGWEHKAFNWFPARKMLAIPFADYIGSAQDPWSSFVSDLRLFEVDVEQGIRFRGSLNLADLYVTHRYDRWSWRWSPFVRRSVMADDYAYAISDAGIRVADMRNPSAPMATARFEPIRD